jgi:hypothetical protein
MTLDEAIAADGEKLLALTGEDHGPFDWRDHQFDFGADAALYGRDTTLAATRRLLDDDPHAAYMVAACVSCVQSATETRPAFVKRIVRAWLDEMGRPAQE